MGIIPARGALGETEMAGKMGAGKEGNRWKIISNFIFVLFII